MNSIFPDLASTAFGKFGAFLRRDTLISMSYKLSFVYSLVGIGFTLTSFFFIARLVSPETPVLEPYGGDYFSFVVIGLAFSSLMGSLNEGLPSAIRNAQVSGTFEALLATRTSLPVIMIGSSLYSFLFSMLSSVLFIALAIALFGMRMGRINLLAALMVTSLTSVCYIGLGILSASFILVYKMGNPLNWLLGSISGLFGGALFPVSVLPPAIRWISRLLPVTYTLEAMRKCLLGSESLAQIMPEIKALLIFSVGILPMSIFLFRIALHKAMKDGTLSHF